MSRTSPPPTPTRCCALWRSAAERSSSPGPGGGRAYAAAEKSGRCRGGWRGRNRTGLTASPGWKKDHPLLAPFADPLHGDLRTLRFRKITRIVPDASSRVLATAQGGSPLLVERAQGAGKRPLSRSRPTTPGASGPSAACIRRWSIRRWATRRPAAPARSRAIGACRPGPAGDPGVVLENGDVLVRNVDPAESAIERTTVRRLARRTGSPRRSPIYRAVRGPARRRPPVRTTDEFWRPIAWGLLIVLAVETFVANRTYA